MQIVYGLCHSCFSCLISQCDKLRLVFAGAQLDDDVSCIVSGGREVVYVVTRSQIHVYNRLEHVRRDLYCLRCRSLRVYL